MKKEIFNFIFSIGISLFILASYGKSDSCGLNNLCELEGYTLLRCTRTSGDFDGDTGEFVELDNGWVVKITGGYGIGIYSSYEDVLIFINSFTHEGKDYTIYKMIVDDAIFDVKRIE